MLFYRVLFRQKHGIVAPCDSSAAYEFGKFDERLYAFIDRRNARFDFFPVRGNGIVKIGSVFI